MKRNTFVLSLALATACADPGPVATTEVALQQYDSCAQLETDLKDMLIQEIEATYDQWRHGGWWGFPGEDTTGGPPSPSTNGPRQEGVDFSGTNNQEEGVDEADFVKTDGYFIYALNGNRLHIFGVPQFGDLDPLSTTSIEGWPNQMLIAGDRAVVFSMVPSDKLPAEHPLRAKLGRQDPNGNWYWRLWEVSKITVLDISDRASPQLERELYLEGWYQTARKIDKSVRAGLYTYMNVPINYWWWAGDQQPTIDELEAAAKAAVRAMTLDDIVPSVYERLPDRTFNVWSLAQSNCSTFYRPTSSQGRGISTILTLDLDTMRFESDQIVTNYATFYASKDYLYLAEPAHDWWWFWWNQRDIDEYNVHAFDIRNARKTFYVGSGRVPGVVKDQFSLSENDGFLRIATTTNWLGRWWLENPPPIENNVYVLQPHGGKLKIVGSVTGLADGERIFTSRFVGDRGFLVTFRNIDPLFTLDLSDPYHPRTVGELEVPGVSTYIHPLGEDALLTIGWGGDETGLNWKTQVSLFNVANFAAPALTDVFELSQDGWAYSEAQWEHKAFQYWGPKKLLALPVSSYRQYARPDSSYPYYEYVSTLKLISVDPATGLSLYGDIDHSPFYNADQDHYWYYVDIRRSIFMGEFIYAISDRGISVNRLADLSPVTSALLPGYSPNDYWWWW